jgi:nucleoside 2-deoxyribosyltransferase
MKPQIYLAGPIQDFKDCANWRMEAERLFEGYGIKVLNPLRHQEQLRINTSNMVTLNDDIHAKEKIIKRRDRLDIQQSQGVLACFTGGGGKSKCRHLH